MRILYVASKFEYGKPELGLSYEHNNFFDCLVRMGHDIVYFDSTGLLQTLGRSRMNRRLLETARVLRPDLMFTCLLMDELDPRTVRTITEGNYCTTFNWFCDDHWRFGSFSRFWAPCFHWVSTTARDAVQWYHSAGYEHVIKTQWAVNPYVYRRLPVPLEYDVTFVGQPHGQRRALVEKLRSAGIQVKAWGDGWDAGRISLEDMIRVFASSRINLNFSGASAELPTARDAARRRLGHWISRLPGGWSLKRRAGRALHSLRQRRSRARSAPKEASTVALLPQIKGRTFEVPGCGGFLLTEYAEDLENFYEPGAEMVSFRNVDDCVSLVRYYLDREEERSRIAAAGYFRTMQEHTFVHRFNAIFERMGLKPAHNKEGQVEVVT